MQADLTHKQTETKQLKPIGRSQAPGAISQFLNAGPRMHGLNATAAMLNSRQPIQSKRFTESPTRPAIDQSFGDRSVLQMVRFPTHDRNGFVRISGVSIFDPESHPTGPLAFVVLKAGGPIYVATGAIGRHPALYETALTMDPEYVETEGKPSVYYAGAIVQTRSGRYAWTNDSGHFTPSDGEAAQAGLPMDRFIPYNEYYRNGTASLDPVMADDKPKFTMGPSTSIAIGDIGSDNYNEPLVGGKKASRCPSCVIL